MEDSQIIKGPPGDSLIVESKARFDFTNTLNMIDGESIETHKIDIAEIDAVWWLIFDCKTVSGEKNYYLTYNLEVRSNELKESKNFKFSLKVTLEGSNYPSGWVFMSKDKRCIDQNVTLSKNFGGYQNFRNYCLALLRSGSFAVYVEVSILKRYGAAKSSKFHNPVSVYKNIVSKNFGMLNDSTFSDFTFIVDEKEFKVHKTILAASSAVFYKMFTTNMKELQNNECVIDNMEPDIFKHLLNFIYGGKLPENLSEIAMSLYEASHQYEILSLMEICIQEIEETLSVATAESLYNWACKYEVEDLKIEAWNFIKREILKIFYPLKSEPPTQKDVRALIEHCQNHEDFLQQFKAL